tara:strand:+ start:1107 stop:2507 length:1401 start_codon:yes stop_codon:yes gene_type:complete
MSDLINLNSLFGDILPPSAADLRAQGMQEAEAAQLSGGMAALLAPQRFNNIRQAAGGLFGVDTSTSKERLQQALTQIDMSSPQGQKKAVELIRTVSPKDALQLQNVFDSQAQASSLNQAQVANQQSQTDTRAAEQASLNSRRGSLGSLVENSSMAAGPKKDALARAAASGAFDSNPEKLLSVLDPADKDKYKVAGGSLFNTETGTWVTPPALGASGSLEIEKIDPDQYDPASFARYQQAVRQAKSPSEGIDALKTLLPKPKDDWQWREAEGTTPEGKPKYVQYPSGDALATVRKEITGANNSGRTQKRRSGDVVEVLQGIEEGINSGELKTSVLGIVLSSVAGTDNYTLEGDLDTIKANLGINALQEARSNSASGASGFGQLTQRELERLESLIASLKTGMNKEDFLERVGRVRADFQRAEKEAKTDWTIEQWLGIEEPPAATATPLSGVTDESIQAAIDRKRGTP